MLPALVPLLRRPSLAHLSLRDRLRLRLSFWLACAWPAASYVLTLLFRVGMGTILVKLVPLLVAYYLDREVMKDRPGEPLPKLVSRTLKLQLAWAIGLEVAGAVAVLLLGVTLGIFISVLLMLGVFVMHLVIGWQTFRESQSQSSSEAP